MCFMECLVQELQGLIGRCRADVARSGDGDGTGNGGGDGEGDGDGDGNGGEDGEGMPSKRRLQRAVKVEADVCMEWVEEKERDRTGGSGRGKRRWNDRVIESSESEPGSPPLDASSYPSLTAGSLLNKRSVERGLGSSFESQGRRRGRKEVAGDRGMMGGPPEGEQEERKGKPSVEGSEAGNEKEGEPHGEGGGGGECDDEVDGKGVPPNDRPQQHLSQGQRKEEVEEDGERFLEGSYPPGTRVLRIIQNFQLQQLPID